MSDDNERSRSRERTTDSDYGMSGIGLSSSPTAPTSSGFHFPRFKPGTSDSSKYRVSTSSGTSNSGSSWSFFRSAGQTAPRHKHSDSFSSIREVAEPLLSPLPNSGADTPLVASGSGVTTPLAMPGVDEEVQRRLRGLRRTASRRDVQLSASLTISETGSSSGSPGSYSSGPSKRNPRKGSTSSEKRNAEGLVAMATKSDNTRKSSKVIVAGRNALKILSVTQPDSDDDNFSHDIVDESGASRTSRLRQSSTSRSTSVKLEEDVDLQSGLLYTSGKNTKGALINDVGWGYDHTANKIMTGNSNGTVALYDVEKTGSKLERLKTHHQSGRGINVVSFGGPSGQGTLLASGCQDGDIKISDVRHTSLITLSSPLDPIRSICFAPRSNSTADPFHLISASESGYLARWDLRQPKQPLERLLAHQGGALTLDWKGSVHDLSTDIPSVDGETVKRHVPNDSWGWLASAGSDGNIKIWDLSPQNQSLHLVHTLHATRPINYIRWHPSPSRPCDLVVTAGGILTNQAESRWQPGIEIWDVRREFLPKQVFWTGGLPSAAFSPSTNPDVLWCLNRTHSAFQQIDIAREADEPLRIVPTATVAWSPEGSIAFAVRNSDAPSIIGKSAAAHETPEEKALPILQTAGLVDGLDPTFDVQAFRFLADQYQHRAREEKDLSDACNYNAEAALAVGHVDAARVWRLAGQWFWDEEQTQASAAATDELSEVADDKVSVEAVDEKAGHSPARALRRTRSQTSPSTPLHHRQHRDLQASRQSSPLVTSQVLSEADISPRLLPKELPKAGQASRSRAGSGTNADLVGSDTSTSSLAEAGDKEDNSASQPSTDEGAVAEEEDGASEDDEPTRDGGSTFSGHTTALNPALSMSSIVTKKRPAMTALSRQPTQDGFTAPMARTTTSSATLSRGSGSATPRSRQMALPLDEISATALARRVSASAAPSGLAALSRSNTTVTRPHARRFPSRKNSDESSASDGHADTPSDNDNGDVTQDGLRERARKKKLSLNLKKGSSSSRKSRSRTRHRTPSNGDTLTSAPGGSKNASRSGSARGKRDLPKGADAGQSAPDMAKLRQLEAQNILHAMMKEHLLKVLQELADEGDVQTSATMACLLKERIGVSQMFLARITSAYLQILRSVDAHIPSASLVKYSTVESLRDASQVETTLRTACGQCERGIQNPPYAKCRKCSASATFCSICHTVGMELWIFCATCGHGAHEECLYAYASDISLEIASLSGIEEPLEVDYFSSRALGASARTANTSSATPTATAPSSPMWLFPMEQALFHHSLTPQWSSGSRMHSRAASPAHTHTDVDSSSEADSQQELPIEALHDKNRLLVSCPSGCGCSCLLTLPLSELGISVS